MGGGSGRVGLRWRRKLVWGRAEKPRLSREVGRKRTVNSTSASTILAWSSLERIGKVTQSRVWPRAGCPLAAWSLVTLRRADNPIRPMRAPGLCSLALGWGRGSETEVKGKQGAPPTSRSEVWCLTQSLPIAQQSLSTPAETLPVIPALQPLPNEAQT